MGIKIIYEPKPKIVMVAWKETFKTYTQVSLHKQTRIFIFHYLNSRHNSGIKYAKGKTGQTVSMRALI